MAEYRLEEWTGSFGKLLHLLALADQDMAERKPVLIWQGGNIVLVGCPLHDGRKWLTAGQEFSSLVSALITLIGGRQ